MDSYKGWILDNTVTVVISNLKQRIRGGCRQAYIVSGNNKQQLKTAREWAGEGYEEVTLENKDFELELLESAGKSYQSGKLSFWNCIITAPSGLKFVVGINSELLLDVLREHTFITGKCTTKLKFIRNNGRVGMINEGMRAYKEVEADKIYKNQLKSSYVKSFTPGKLYYSLRLREIYLGEFYEWVDVVKKNSQIAECKVLAVPKKKKLFISELCLNSLKSALGDIGSISELYKVCTENIRESTNNVMYYAEFTSVNNLYSGIPKRLEGEQILLSDDFSGIFNEYQNENIKYCYKLYNKYKENRVYRPSYYSDDYTLKMIVRNIIDSYGITVDKENKHLDELYDFLKRCTHDNFKVV